MTTTNEVRLERLRIVAQSLAELRATARRLELMRDELVRELYADHVRPGEIVAAAGIVRSRMHQLLHSPAEDSDETEWADFAEHFDAAIETAVDRWRDAGEEGSVEDYFPLESLVTNVHSQ